MILIQTVSFENNLKLIVLGTVKTNLKEMVVESQIAFKEAFETRFSRITRITGGEKL